MRKWVSWALGIVALSVLGLWVAAPSIIRDQLHKRHPEVAFGTMDVHWGQVVLHGVTITKGWFVVEAKDAIIDVRTEAVHLDHGIIEVNLDQKPPSTSAKTEQPNVTLDDFGLTIKSRARDLTFSALHVRINSEVITSENARVTYKGYVADLVKAVVPRNLKKGVVEEVSFPYGLSDGRHTIMPTLTQIEFDRESQAVAVGHAACDFDVGHEHVGLAADGLKMQLDGVGPLTVAVSISQLGITHPWLSSGSVHFQHITFEADPKIIDAPFDVKVGGSTLHFDPIAMSVKGDESCDTWLDTLPPEFHAGPLSAVKFNAGNLSFALGIKPKPFLDVKGSCTSTCDKVTEPRHKFSYITYDAHGDQNAERRTIGPDMRDDWVPLWQINSTMPVAVMNMEDFGFRSHHGYLPAALEQSFEADVDSGKFARGGSTITMQTAKNLWLSREKTFGRKIEELFLSQVLESCFTKDEIMELYLNIVEFGPDVYGLHQAAEHYFKIEPMSLDPAESFYLAWILPRPRKAPPPNAATMARMNTLMRMLASEGRITDTMLLSVEEADTTGWEAPP